MVDGLPEADNVGVGLAPLGVENVLEAAEEDRRDKDVGEGDALADEEGTGREGLLEVVEVLQALLLGSVNLRLLVGGSADEGAEPRRDGREEVGVGPRGPAEDVGGVLLGLAEEAGLVLLRRKVRGDGDGLGELVVALLERRDEAERELGEVLGADTALSEGAGLDPLDVEALVLGDDERDAGAGVALELRMSQRELA